MICDFYANTRGHQCLYVLTNIKMPEVGKINVFLIRSPDTMSSAVCFGFCKIAKEQNTFILITYRKSCKVKTKMTILAKVIHVLDEG